MNIKELKQIKRCLEHSFYSSETCNVPIIACDDTPAEIKKQTNQIQQLINEIDEMLTIEQRMIDNAQTTNDKLHLVSEEDLMTIINRLSYENYATIYRKQQETKVKPTFEQFKETLQYEGMDSIAEEVLFMGFEVISDIFDDNEASGHPCDKEGIAEKQMDQVIAMISNK